MNSYPFVPLLSYLWDSTFLGDWVRDQIGSTFASKGSCVGRLELEVVVPPAKENLFLIEFQAPGLRAEFAIGIGVQTRLIEIRN